MSYLAKVMVTTCQVHLPSSPTTGNKTKERYASEVRLRALLPLLFCEWIFVIQSPEQQQSDSLVHLTVGFFPSNPCQEPAWWPCWGGWWCGTCQPMTAVLPQPRKQGWATLPPPPHPCASTGQFSLCDTGNVCCYNASHFCPLEPWFEEHKMFCPIFGHKESSLSTSLTVSCTWMCSSVMVGSCTCELLAQLRGLSLLSQLE